MKEVTLQFDLLKTLIDFTLTIDIKNCLIDEANFRLTCVLQESEIELAEEGFGAKIISDLSI